MVLGGTIKNLGDGRGNVHYDLGTNYAANLGQKLVRSYSSRANPRGLRGCVNMNLIRKCRPGDSWSKCAQLTSLFFI